jgi:hypothetical protein
LWIEKRRTGAGFAHVGQERLREDQEPTGGDSSILLRAQAGFPTRSRSGEHGGTLRSEGTSVRVAEAV